jgi:hypothetical protein
MKYNGWTNYETWKVNLELIDSEFLGDLLQDFDDFDNFVDAVKDHAEEYAYFNVQENSFAESAVHALLADVNWYEIAEHIQMAYAEDNVA